MKSPRTTIDLRTGEANPDDFRDLLSEIQVGNLARAYGYAPREGSVPLRETFVDLLARCTLDVESTMLTHGALNAIDLITRRSATTSQPRRFFMVDPGYREAMAIARRNGFEVTALDGALSGLTPVHLDDVLYVVPALNNPDGQTLDAEQCARLALLTAESGVTLVEDDAYGPLLAAHLRPPSVAALALLLNPEARAVRLASLSKSVMPGLRVCFVEGSKTVVDEVTQERQDYGLSPIASLVAQTVLEHDDLYRRLVERSRLVLEERQTVAAQVLQQNLISPHTLLGGGYFLWLGLPRHRAGLEGYAHLERRADLEVADGSPFLLNPTVPELFYVRLSVAREPIDRLHLGMRRLAQVVEESA